MRIMFSLQECVCVETRSISLQNVIITFVKIKTIIKWGLKWAGGLDFPAVGRLAFYANAGWTSPQKVASREPLMAKSRWRQTDAMNNQSNLTRNG